jgi:hypothetical protein
MTKSLKLRGSQRVSKRADNAASVNCEHVQPIQKGEKIMNTFTNAMHPKKEADRTARNNKFQNTAIIIVILALVTTAAISGYIANRPVAAAENNSPVPYSNALEMQYARPWLEKQNKPAISYSNALELQYAQPWLDKAEQSIVVTGNAQGQTPLNCSSSMEMLYACKNGFSLP